MLHTVRYTAILALTLSLGFSLFATPTAQAGTISSVQVFAGQDGTGTGMGTTAVPAIITLNTNNDNPAGVLTDNNQAVIMKRFDRSGIIDIVFNVQPSGGTTEYKIFESVDNNTFINWSSYRMELGFGIGAAFNNIGGVGDGLDFDFNQFDTPPTSTAFMTVAPFEDFLFFTNGIQMTGAETYQFRIDVPDLPQGVTSFTLRQIPTAVPEPGVFVVAAFAGCGLLLRRRLF